MHLTHVTHHGSLAASPYFNTNIDIALQILEDKQIKQISSPGTKLNSLFKRTLHDRLPPKQKKKKQNACF